jgi:hypothetical protein
MNPIIREAASNFQDIPNGVLTVLLILAALAIAGIAVFSQNPGLKALALAYILFP